MKHCSSPPEQDDLLRLVEINDSRQDLSKLAAPIDREVFESRRSLFFPSGTGCPVAPPRLFAGLLYLRHAFRLLDEVVVARWVGNPYCQHLTGETFFPHHPPNAPSSLMRWRKRIDKEGVEWMLTQTIPAGTFAPGSLKRVAVDSTVTEKAIAHPTNARLYERARAQLVAPAVEVGVLLHRSYARLAPRLAVRVARCAHATQLKRMRKALKALKGEPQNSEKIVR